MVIGVENNFKAKSVVKVNAWRAESITLLLEFYKFNNSKISIRELSINAIKYFHFAVLCIGLFGCVDKTKKGQSNALFQRDSSASWGENHKLFTNIRLIEKYINLQPIENGFDSIQIRIWVSYPFTDAEQVIILKNQNNNWNGFLYDYKPINANGFDTLHKYKVTIKQLIPNGSWVNLIDSLYNNNILTLPNYTKIKGYPIANDPIQVTIEISTKSYYRLYTYPSPGMGNKIESRNILNILDLLSRYFGIKYLYKI